MINKKVTIERQGKKPQQYELIQYIRKDTYFAVKTNGGERPRRVYFIKLQNKDIIK